MNIFEQIWNWLKNLFKKWFNPIKKPLVKITILTMFLCLFFPYQSQAQRSDVQAIFVYFYQPNIENNDFWTVRWYNGAQDSIDVYKNDTLHVKIRNLEGEYVNWINIPSELDTMAIRLKVERAYHYDLEFVFDIISKDTDGLASDPCDSVRVYFMVSDINQVDNPDSERGYDRGDDSIDGLDLIELSKNWGKTGVGFFEYYDITGDGNVDGLDLLQLARDWGRTWTP